MYLFNNKKRTNPKDIADAFADYYSFLFNLKNDSGTPQPSDKSIRS